MAPSSPKTSHNGSNHPPAEEFDSTSPDNLNESTKQRITQLEAEASHPTRGDADDSTEPTLQFLRPVSRSWPVIDREPAFIGPVGKHIKAIELETEADPVAIMLQALVGFGNLVGRKAVFPHEANKHFTNEFLVLVGDTSVGRKGTSWGYSEGMLCKADPDWASTRVSGGLSSGEGLIHEVRDTLKDDPGVTDKRFLAMEGEFANVLKVLERQGNSLSPVLRKAWDGGELKTMAKMSPARCAEPHISLIGHITATELHRYFTETEAANGLGNRHLFACVKRQRLLPEGGSPDQKAIEECTEAMGFAARSINGPLGMVRDDEAKQLWGKEYERLAADRPGLVGSLSARCLPHVCRMAMIYSLLDEQRVITARNLRAAIACWDYCEASLCYIFGDSLGDKLRTSSANVYVRGKFPH